MGSRLRSLKSITNYVGTGNIAHQVLETLIHLVQGDAIEHLAKNNLVNNPYWPPELARQAKTLHHERSF